jgi:hypothetical protein
MKVSINGNRVIVDREGKKYKTETAWWYALKKHLNENGEDLIKKIMAKDGHLYGDEQRPYYLRDRKAKYCYYDPQYAVRFIHIPDKVELNIQRA